MLLESVGQRVRGEDPPVGHPAPGSYLRRLADSQDSRSVEPIGRGVADSAQRVMDVHDAPAGSSHRRDVLIVARAGSGRESSRLEPGREIRQGATVDEDVQIAEVTAAGSDEPGRDEREALEQDDRAPPGASQLRDGIEQGLIGEKVAGRLPASLHETGGFRAELGIDPCGGSSARDSAGQAAALRREPRRLRVRLSGRGFERPEGSHEQPARLCVES